MRGRLNDAAHNDRCKAGALISSNYQRCNSSRGGSRVASGVGQCVLTPLLCPIILSYLRARQKGEKASRVSDKRHSEQVCFEKSRPPFYAPSITN